ncbi:MAG: endonuclease NucS, partial [Candidatus Thermoplasmatota archaeon]|nr:endonuclease NucS [Candidatus Thermoplasmatota archaeon]
MDKKKNVLHIIQYPSASQAESFIKENHQKNAEKTILQLIGTCIVQYHGRAKSFLDSGDRIIIIKQDGNLLVHQPIMREPINWQPAGSIIEYIVKDNSLILKSRHRKPAEKMIISFTEIFSIIVSQLNDSAQLKIAGMESDVVKHIINNPSCIEEGLRIQNQEKQVRSGLIDVFAYDKDHTPVIIEVKRSLATISNVHQLRMYVQDMQHHSEKTLVRGILCAPRIPDMIKNLLQDYNLEWKEVEHEIILSDDQQKTLNE